MSKIVCACHETFCSTRKKGRLHGGSGKKPSRMKKNEKQRGIFSNIINIKTYLNELCKFFKTNQRG